MTQARPLAVTMGEPSGIGGEAALAAWLRRDAGGTPPFFLIDDPERVRRLAAETGLAAPVLAIAEASETAAAYARGLPVLPLPRAVSAVAGRLDAVNAAAVICSIETAVRLVRNGDAAAVVTNPIHKKALYDAGFAFPGHTEFLGALAGVAHPVMMLAAPALRVVPVTIHQRLRDALDRLAPSEIVRVARVTADALRRDFGVAAPRLAVAGVNPHAGEGGALGPEDDAIVRPAIEALRAQGIDAFGPQPPDTMFTARARPGYDAAICMYHDQALIPLKALDFDGGVNVTLGLPFVRTSPDHGAALDIAGRGVADPSSLIAAMRLAAMMADRRAASGRPPS